MPATMTMLLGVAVDSHKVCFVEDIGPQQQKARNAIAEGLDGHKSVEPDASSVRPAVPEPPAAESPVNVALMAGQAERLRQDVAEVAAYEPLARIEHLPGYLSGRDEDSFNGWQAAANAGNREGQFMLGLYCITRQPEDAQRWGIGLLKAAMAGGRRAPIQSCVSVSRKRAGFPAGQTCGDRQV